MNKKQKKIETYHRILEAAAEIFSQVGFAGARVDEIAARAKVNKATIYYHIGDKKALYQAVLSKVISVTADRIAQRIEKVDSPREKLAIYIQTMTRRVDENPHVPRIMMRELAAGGKNFPEPIIQDLIRILGHLSGILEDGVSQGEFMETSPFLVHLMIMGAYAFYKTSRGLVDQIAAGREIHQTLLKNIYTDASTEIEKLIINALCKPSVKLENERELH